MHDWANDQLEQRYTVVRLAHSRTYSVRAFCFGRRVCLSVDCLSRVRSQKLGEIGAKFRHRYRKSGPESKKPTSDFALEVAKCASLLSRSVKRCSLFYIKELPCECVFLGYWSLRRLLDRLACRLSVYCLYETVQRTCRTFIIRVHCSKHCSSPIYWLQRMTGSLVSPVVSQSIVV